MRFKVLVQKKALKFLEKLDAETRKRVTDSLR